MLDFAQYRQWLAEDAVDSYITFLEYKLFPPGMETRSKTYLKKFITVIIFKEFQNLLGLTLE